ncbi:hypothetical protein HYPSUDRAFT_820263 [Hypholoma sublateritium FD-334 SS-4]|uniref:Uncharacterized protein n=1 Tax=Hypholoma sublateritium (strain FD-334 SS-4) TaxID=945553 RepID=A0A0D2PJV0_HYPSF|nr:hypothetical protein HYPSUDRAFT_820263 [Hypholoma sublateritium FD-334 SS-4]
MALNDPRMTASSVKSHVVYPGVANPTSKSTTDAASANFVDNPTSRSAGAGAATSAGADSMFRGGRDARRSMKEQAGVIEAYPGIIESTNIDPLNENSNKDDGWANVRKLRK